MSILGGMGRTLVAGAVTAGLLGTLAAGASAAPKPVVHELHQSRYAVLHHWTAKRLRHVKPAKLHGVDQAAQDSLHTVPAGEGTPTEGSGAPAPEAQAAPLGAPHKPKLVGAHASWYGQELPWQIITEGYTSAVKPVGRLFFTKPNGAGSVCSASVVARNVILTAAHCVRDGATGAQNN